MPAVKRIITITLNPAVDRVIEVAGLTPGAHQPCRELTRTPGGKGVNVSRVLATLGVPSIATGFLGEANRGDFAEFLGGSLVTDEFVTLPGRTRENVTITDSATGLDTHLRDAGLPVDRNGIDRLAEKLRSLAEPERIVVFSGSLPPGIEPADWAHLVGMCAQANAPVAVDTAAGALRAAALAHRLWLIKPNVQELAELVGRKLGTTDEQVAAARELPGEIDNVLLSRGRDGACLITEDLALHARVDLVPGDVRNTVGCGDVLLGAFLAALANAEDERLALRKAVAAASASACHVATAAFDADLARRLLETAELEEI